MCPAVYRKRFHSKLPHRLKDSAYSFQQLVDYMSLLEEIDKKQCQKSKRGIATQNHGGRAKFQRYGRRFGRQAGRGYGRVDSRGYGGRSRHYYRVPMTQQMVRDGNYNGDRDYYPSYGGHNLVYCRFGGRYHKGYQGRLQGEYVQSGRYVGEGRSGSPSVGRENQDGPGNDQQKDQESGEHLAEIRTQKTTAVEEQERLLDVEMVHRDEEVREMLRKMQVTYEEDEISV